MIYRMVYGDTPAIIAKKFGVSLPALFSANPQKSIVTWWGSHTWDSVPGEAVNVPTAAPAPAPTVAAVTAGASLAAVNPCDQSNASLVCEFQRSIGHVADGKYGTETSHALASLVTNAPAPCHPRPPWWARHGRTNCGPVITTSPIVIRGTPPIFAGTVGDAAHDAAVSLAATNPCSADNVSFVCLFQAAVGLKQDGKYGHDTAAALKAKVGDAAPAPCQHPAWWVPHGQSNCTPTPSVAPTSIVSQAPQAVVASPAAQALAASNPCDQASVSLVSAFQQSAGLKVDGKYGTDTSHALAALVPNAPAPCHPRPAWWGGGAAVRPPPSGGAVVVKQDGLVSPEPKKKLDISTGALLAGGIGAVALVGVVVAAAGGKKAYVRYRTRRAPQPAPAPAPPSSRNPPSTKRSAVRR
jgi:hypothetical protein